MTKFREASDNCLKEKTGFDFSVEGFGSEIPFIAYVVDQAFIYSLWKVSDMKRDGQEQQCGVFLSSVNTNLSTVLDILLAKLEETVKKERFLEILKISVSEIKKQENNSNYTVAKKIIDTGLEKLNQYIQKNDTKSRGWFYFFFGFTLMFGVWCHLIYDKILN